MGGPAPQLGLLPLDEVLGRVIVQFEVLRHIAIGQFFFLDSPNVVAGDFVEAFEAGCGQILRYSAVLREVLGSDLFEFLGGSSSTAAHFT